MLNGMSGACNSLWNFQIQERPKCDDEEGPLELTVVDLNFSGEVQTDDGVGEFQQEEQNLLLSHVIFQYQLEVQ